MTTAPVNTSEDRPGEVDTGRLPDASRMRVILTVVAIVASTEIVAFQVAFIGMSARYIGVSFPTAGSQLPWLATIYALVGGVAVPVLGKLSDRIGKKKVMVACLTIALFGSVLDALTDSWTLLLVGRALQGIAMPAIAISYGLMRDLIPRKQVSMAIALAGGGTGVAAVLGPLAGGALTDTYGWRSLFWFCVIWGAATVVPLIVGVPETKLRVRSKLDLIGVALLGAGIALIMIYLSLGSDWGWTRALPWVIGGALLLVVFYVWETRTADPIMDPRLLRSGRFLAVIAVSAIGNGLLQGTSYVVAYISEGPGGAAGDAVKKQIVEGAAAAASAKAHVPASALAPFFSVKGDLVGLNLSLFQFTLEVTLGLAVVYVLVAPLTGWASTRSGLQRPIAAAMLAAALAAFLLALFHHSVLELALILLLMGASAGLYLGAAPNMLVEAVPQEQQGIAGGMYGAFNSFGAAAATAIVAAVIAANPLVLHFAAPGQPASDTKLTTGALAQLPAGTAYTQLFIIFGCVAAAGFVLTLFMRHFRQPATGGTRY